jgi:hypothetical protein
VVARQPIYIAISRALKYHPAADEKLPKEFAMRKYGLIALAFVLGSVVGWLASRPRGHSATPSVLIAYPDPHDQKRQLRKSLVANPIHADEDSADWYIEMNGTGHWYSPRK